LAIWEWAPGGATSLVLYVSFLVTSKDCPINVAQTMTFNLGRSSCAVFPGPFGVGADAYMRANSIRGEEYMPTRR
jgi:hypothetical protein